MLHDPDTGARLGTLYGNAGDILSLEFSPNGKILASASENETITLWDTATWTKLRSFSPGSVVTFSYNGSTLVSGSKDGRIILWDVDSGDQLQTLDAHSGQVTSLDFVNSMWETDKLASGSADGTIKIWSFNKH